MSSPKLQNADFLFQNYKLGKKIGTSPFGTMFECYNRVKNAHLMLKEYNKACMGEK